MRLVKYVPSLLSLVFLAACGNTTSMNTTPDLAVPIVLDLATPGCTSDTTCAAPTAHCDVKTGTCVGCLADADCGLGQLCSAGACVAGCSQSHGCGDAGVCDNDAGICRSCMVDGDCGDPKNPRCDAPNRKCVPCLPTNDNCAAGTYCAVTAGVYACAPGCGVDSDCLPGRGDGGVSMPIGDGGVLPSMACCNHVCANVSSDDNNCSSCGNVCANGKSCCAAACVDTTSDSNNCGACGAACMLPNGAVAACAASKCAIAKCAAGTADCDNNPKNGCEVNINSDVNNCLGCGNSCVAAHAVSACNMGCSIAMCNVGFADCDQNYADGCEVDITSTLANCGACGNACPMVANGSPGCANSACTIASCSGTFADCNMMVNDGCEVDTSGDPKNCGGCKNVCPVVQNGAPGCAMGVCGIGACTAPFKDCDMNPNNGCEVNTSNDVSNCGACAKVCPGIPNGVAGCAASACVIASCNANFKDCNNNLNDGCEVNTSNDIMNCGACGHVCPAIPNGSPICTNGVCGATGCVLPFKDCDGNPANGCESNTNTDVKNCGLCGDVCPAVANGTIGCNVGKCGIGVCNMGFKDCNMNPNDGCEINSTNDVNNCNACANKCVTANGTPACTNSACVTGSCNGGFGDCNKNPADGCEDNVLTDVNNCGACGNVCPGVANGAPACINGKCGIGACNAPFRDCNGLPGDGCEDNTGTDANNCGTCGHACGGNLTCVNSACAGCLNGGLAPPNACLAGTDPETGAPWVVCNASCANALISHNNANGGTYHALQICNNLGYGSIGTYGGTCTNICGYCAAASCNANGPLTFDGGGNAGSDGHGIELAQTVWWHCIK